MLGALSDHIIGRIGRNLKISYEIQSLVGLEENIEKMININEHFVLYTAQEEKILNHLEKLGELKKNHGKNQPNNNIKSFKFLNLEPETTNKKGSGDEAENNDKSQSKLTHCNYKYSIFYDPLLMIPQILCKMKRVSEIKHYRYIYIQN